MPSMNSAEATGPVATYEDQSGGRGDRMTSSLTFADEHLPALKLELLREANRLAAIVHEDLRGPLHTTPS